MKGKINSKYNLKVPEHTHAYAIRLPNRRGLDIFFRPGRENLLTVDLFSKLARLMRILRNSTLALSAVFKLRVNRACNVLLKQTVRCMSKHDRLSLQYSRVIYNNG